MGLSAKLLAMLTILCVSVVCGCFGDGLTKLTESPFDPIASEPKCSVVHILNCHTCWGDPKTLQIWLKNLDENSYSQLGSLLPGYDDYGTCEWRTNNFMSVDIPRGVRCRIEAYDRSECNSAPDLAVYVSPIFEGDASGNILELMI